MSNDVWVLRLITKCVFKRWICFLRSSIISGVNLFFGIILLVNSFSWKVRIFAMYSHWTSIFYCKPENKRVRHLNKLSVCNIFLIQQKTLKISISSFRQPPHFLPFAWYEKIFSLQKLLLKVSYQTINCEVKSSWARY